MAVGTRREICTFWLCINWVELQRRRAANALVGRLVKKDGAHFQIEKCLMIK